MKKKLFFLICFLIDCQSPTLNWSYNVFGKHIEKICYLHYAHILGCGRGYYCKCCSTVLPVSFGRIDSDEFIERNETKIICIGLANVPSGASWSQTAVTVAGQANGAAGSGSNYLHWNRGISISSDGTLYIADRVNNRVVFLELDSLALPRIFISESSSSGSQFNFPADVYATDTAVYVLDSSNYRVQKYARNGTNPVTMPGASSFSTSYYLFIDGYGNLYLSLNVDNKVIRFAPNTSSSVVVAGSDTQGSSAMQLNGPNGIIVDDAGTVYIADTRNHRIQKWKSGALAGSTVAGTGIDGTTLAQLSFPESFVIDTNGYMYIADRGNNRILQWKLGASSGICIVACTGVPGLRSDQLDYPLGLAFDSDGSLYVSDDSNNRVQKFQVYISAGECLKNGEDRFECASACIVYHSCFLNALLRNTHRYCRNTLSFIFSSHDGNHLNNTNADRCTMQIRSLRTLKLHCITLCHDQDNTSFDKQCQPFCFVTWWKTNDTSDYLAFRKTNKYGTARKQSNSRKNFSSSIFSIRSNYPKGRVLVKKSEAGNNDWPIT